MKIPRIAFVALLGFGLVGCASTTTTPLASNTWVEGPCSTTQPGVTLSIDYLGKVTTRCALGFNGDGWSLFEAAGFEVTGTAKYPTAFACKIDGQPKDANCDDSGASGSYWGYFVQVGDNWEYATTGARDHRSTCGSSEGWVFMETEKTVSHLPKFTDFVCDPGK